jgi:hypothetical protein
MIGQAVRLEILDGGPYRCLPVTGFSTVKLNAVNLSTLSGRTHT